MVTIFRRVLILWLLSRTIISYPQINFKPFQSFYTGAKTENIAVDDLNNDSLNDVVVTTRPTWPETDTSDYRVMIYYQELTGGFSDPKIYYYPVTDNNGAHTLDIGDLNNDSLNDIVIGFGASIQIFYQSKSSFGNFDSITKFHSGSRVDAIKIKDINNDTLDDIIATLSNENYFRIFYQCSPDSFYHKDYTAPGLNNADIEIADINNDSLLDILLVSLSPYHGYYIIRQDSMEIFDNPVYYNLAEDFKGIAVDDLNNDNLKDIVITNFINDAYIYVLYNDGSDNFYQNPVLYNAYDGPSPVSIADLNCDGNNEIVTAHEGWHAITVYDKTPSGDYTDYIKFSNVYGKYICANNCMDIADLTNDLSPDVVLASGEENWILFINNSKPYITDTFTIETVLYNDTSFTTLTYVNTIPIELNDTSQIIRIDSTIILRTYFHKTKRLFNYHRREGDICSGFYMDSILIDSTDKYESKTIYDTLYTSFSYDTIQILPDNICDNAEDNITIYPNPSTGIININYIDNSTNYNRIGIQIYNNLGTLLYNRKIIPGVNESIEIRNKGTYILKVNTDFETTTYKIIII